MIKNIERQRGAIGKVLLVLLAVLVAGGLWLWLDEDAGKGLKKEAQLKTMEMIGEVAVKRLGGSSVAGEETHGSAVDMIRNPIEVRKVADNVFYATGVGNTVMVTTSEGNVLLDTGLVIQAAKQLRLLKEQVSDAPVRYIVLSHSHADHIGGTKFWVEEGTDIVTHRQFEEEQRYLSSLENYQYGRNRTLFPWMPEKEAEGGMEMLKYGGVEPTITVADWEVFSFTLGETEFQVIGTPGAEGADNAVLWLPAAENPVQRRLFRTPVSAVPQRVHHARRENTQTRGVCRNRWICCWALEPEIIIPSHLNPTVGAAGNPRGYVAHT